MTLASAYGFAPLAVDALTLRESMVMILGARARRRERLEFAGLNLDGLMNYGGFRGEGFEPVAFGHHFETFTGGSGSPSGAPDRIDVKAVIPLHWLVEA